MGARLRNDQQEGNGGEEEQQVGEEDGGGGGRQAHCVASSPANPTLKMDREASPFASSLTEQSSVTTKAYVGQPAPYLPF